MNKCYFQRMELEQPLDLSGHLAEQFSYRAGPVIGLILIVLAPAEVAGPEASEARV